MSRRTALLYFCIASVTAASLLSAPATAEEVLRPKVMIISPWEYGEPSGDAAGEYQRWVEREELTTIVEFPFAAHDIHMNDAGIAAINTGPGVSNSAIVITALGLDERFDLRNTYWIVGGIAGGDPDDVTIGSAAWARWIVDGDLMRSIDSREVPEDWPYGLFPSDGIRPNDRSGGFSYPNQAFQLNPQLVGWAYALSKDVELMDHEKVANYRKRYVGQPRAQAKPSVILGESLGSNAYWSGVVLTKWANDWVSLYTGGQGNFVMTNVEDNGTLRALTRLAKLGKVDRDRVLVLRTASNFSHAPPDMDAVESVTAEYLLNGETALENIYRVASPVVHALVDGWDRYEHQTPVTD